MDQEKKVKKGPGVVILNNKKQIPLFGLGTSQIKSTKIFIQLFRKAFSLGVRLIDTAMFYNNQQIIGKNYQLGEALQTCYKQQRIKRQQLFITTKTWNDKNLNFVMGLKKSLKLLKTSYVDLFLLHWPCSNRSENGQYMHKEISVAWKQMEQCIRKGYARSIGVSNFNGQNIMDMLSYVNIIPAVNQIQLHLICVKNLVQIFKHIAQLQDQDLLIDIANKHGKTPIQVALKFIMQKDITVIPKTQNIFRLVQNFESWKFDLTEDQNKKIKTLNKNIRIICPQENSLFSFLPILD